MALTLPRWMLIAVLGCAAVWFGLFHDRRIPVSTPAAPSNPFGLNFKPSNASLASAAMNQAADRLRQLEIRDSVLRRVGGRPNPGLTVMIDRAFDSHTSRLLDSLIKRRWASLGASATTPVVVAVVYDSASTVRGFPRRYAGTSIPVSVFLPHGANDSPCVSIMRFSISFNGTSDAYRARLKRNLTSPETIGALFGPCVYYAAFGTPSPEIEHWLNGRWGLAHFAGWNEPAEPWKPVERPYPSSFFERLASLNDPAWQIRYVVAPPGITCLAGLPGRCSALVLGGRARVADSAWQENVISSNGSNESIFFLPRFARSLGPSDGWIISEMARTLGKERFEQFWKSSAPTADAFRAAAGVSLDDWVRDWARRTYGPATVGPYLSPAAVLAGLTVLVLALALAITLEHRRCVA